MVAGSFIGYAVTYTSLNGKISDLQEQLQYYSSNGQNVNTFSSINDSSSLASLYQNVKSSVVVVQDLVLTYDYFRPTYSLQQGSGFVTSVNGQQVIVTNNHVVESSINITVTFADGRNLPSHPIRF